jgi:hypothetical protein
MFDVTDDGCESEGDVEYDEDSYAECSSCDWKGKWGETFVAPAPEQALTAVLKANPEEALEVARWAVLGLLIVRDGAERRIILPHEDYESAADYAEHVDQCMQRQPHLSAKIKELQAQAELKPTL